MRNIMKLKISLTLILFLFGNKMVFASGLKELWQTLQDKNLELRELKALENSSAAKYSAESGGFFPKIDVRSSFQKTDSLNPEFETNTSNAWGLQFQQVLFDLTTVRKIQSALIRRELAKVQLEAKRQELMYQLMVLYWQNISLRNQSQLLDDALRGQLATLEHQVELAMDEGLRDQAELSTFLLQTSTLRLKALEIKSELYSNTENLAILLCDDVNSLIPDRIEVLPQMSLLDRDVKNPLAVIEDLELAASSAELNETYSTVWPKMSIFGQLDHAHLSAPNKDSSSYKKQAVYGIALDFNLFNGGQDQNRIGAKNFELIASQNRLKMYRLNQIVSNNGMVQRLTTILQRAQEAESQWDIAKLLKSRALRQQEAGLGSFDILIGPVIQELQLALLREEARWDYVRTLARELLRKGLLDESTLTGFSGLKEDENYESTNIPTIPRTPPPSSPIQQLTNPPTKSL